MSDLNERISGLVELMNEFDLAEAKMSGEGWHIGLSKIQRQTASTATLAHVTHVTADAPEIKAVKAESGRPIRSPMNGVYYTSPSPGDPPFVKVGDSVTQGMVIGLIEAMKVFNEVTASESGEVKEMVAENGQIVEQGETLLTVG